MIGVMCPEEMKSSEETVSAPSDLSEMLGALEAGVFQLRQERNKLRRELDELRRQPSIQKHTRPRLSRNGRKRPRPRAQQRHSKNSDPVQTPTVQTEFPNEPGAPRKTRNALGRTLIQLRAGTATAVPRDEVDGRPASLD